MRDGHTEDQEGSEVVFPCCVGATYMGNYCNWQHDVIETPEETFDVGLSWVSMEGGYFGQEFCCCASICIC